MEQINIEEVRDRLIKDILYFYDDDGCWYCSSCGVGTHNDDAIQVDHCDDCVLQGVLVLLAELEKFRKGMVDYD